MGIVQFVSHERAIAVVRTESSLTGEFRSGQDAPVVGGTDAVVVFTPIGLPVALVTPAGGGRRNH